MERADVAVRQHSYGDAEGAQNGAFEQHVDGAVDGVDEVDGLDGVDYDNSNPRNWLGNIH